MIKLHIGCGNIKKEEYINIDVRETSVTDRVCDVSNLDYEKESVDLIEGYHIFEHLHPIKALINWHKILKPGGKVIMEMPDVEEVIKQEYVKKKHSFKSLLCHIYGAIETFDANLHKYGYSKETIREWFEKYGFCVNLVSCGTKTKRRPNSHLTLRVEATKI